MNGRRTSRGPLLAIVATALALALATAIFVRRMPDVRADAENSSLVVADASGAKRGPFRYALAYDSGDEWAIWLSTKPLSCRAIETGAHQVEGDPTLELAYVRFPMAWKEGPTAVEVGGMRGAPCKTSTRMEPPPPTTSSFKIESVTDHIRGTLRVDQRGDINGTDPCAKPIGTYHFTGGGHFAAPICSTPLQRIGRWWAR